MLSHSYLFPLLAGERRDLVVGLDSVAPLALERRVRGFFLLGLALSAPLVFADSAPALDTGLPLLGAPFFADEDFLVPRLLPRPLGGAFASTKSIFRSQLPPSPLKGHLIDKQSQNSLLQDAV